MVRAKVKWLVPMACLAISACDNDAADVKGSEVRISGPVGTEYSVHPKFEGPNRERISGCCSFAPGASKIRKLEGDLDGREVVGKGFHATFSFGPAATAGHKPPKGRKTLVDGVEAFRQETEKPKSGDPNYRYTAVVPLNSEAEKRRVDAPQLEIVGWCQDNKSCVELKRILDSVRF